GNNEKALEDYNKIIEIEPETTEFYQRRAEFYQKIGNNEKALEDYNKIIEIEPEMAEHYQRRAEFYQKIGNIEKALEDYNKTIEIEPETTVYYQRRAEFYQKIGNIEKALEDYNKEIELEPEEHVWYGNRACFYSHLGNLEKTLEDLSKANELNCYNDSIYEVCAETFQKTGDNEKALEVYNKLVEQNQENYEGYFHRAKFFEKTGNYEKALEDCNKIIEIRPKPKNVIDVFNHISSMPFFLRFLVHAKLDNEENALDDLRVFKEEKEKEESKAILPQKKQETPEGQKQTEKQFDFKTELKQIGTELNLKYLVKSLEILFELESLENYSKLAEFICKLDFEKVPSELNPDVSKVFSENYKNFSNLSEVLQRDGKELFLIRAKLCFLKCFYEVFSKETEMKKDTEKKAKLQQNFIEIYFKVSEALEEEHARLQKEAAVQARNEIISYISHTLKNLFASIVNPLEILRNGKTYDELTIQKTLRGMEISSQIVSAMNSSLKGTLDDFLYDAQTPKSQSTLKNIFTDALVYSLTNLFDTTYFVIFSRNYLQTKEIFTEAKTEWNKIILNKNLDEISGFINKFFCRFEFDLGKAAELTIGNEKQSAVKLLTLFQEMFFNAFKYAGFIERENRFVEIVFSVTELKFLIKIENAFIPSNQVKTTGIGLAVIGDFAEILKAENKVKKTESTYTLEFSFTNLWRKR
ncbi:tetratricopeptide repeat protein, partial [bacterium]|nr:tetratricopeptide repeat protein [bacterium]